MRSPNTLYHKNDGYRFVAVAGSFNNWCQKKDGTVDFNMGLMELNRNNLWELPVEGLNPGVYEYKYVINGRWEEGSNRVFIIKEDGNLGHPFGNVESVTIEKPDLLLITLYSPAGNVDDIKFKLSPAVPVTGKLFLKKDDSFDPERIVVRTEEPLDITLRYTANIRIGSEETDIEITPGTIFYDHFISDKPLGVSYSDKNDTTTFRLFAPRAQEATLYLFSEPKDTVAFAKETMIKDADGVFESSLCGKFKGNFYYFKLSGQSSSSTMFTPEMALADPYAKGCVYHDGKCIVTVPENDFLWTDKDFSAPLYKDIILCELSVRDYTSSDTSEVEKPLRGKFMGLASTEYLDTGIDHLKKMGYNAVELLPVQEFDDSPHGAYHWGYMTTHFFSPEASYSVNPSGGQIDEFKHLVNTLHENNIAVIMDVVYNHTGEPHFFKYYDYYYYYRTTNNMNLTNFSGCGNDFKSEHPMARRLIIDSILYWIKEYHIDGFRFDLAELIDVETLMILKQEAEKLKPGIIMIAEPWSFRGTIKDQLKGTGWASWNDDFRNKIKDFVLNGSGREYIPIVIEGSCQWWAENPLQSVNYVESHDNYTLTDFLSFRSDKNGRLPAPIEIHMNKICALLTVFSLGIPMFAQGQEFLRSKGGNENSYNAGDEVNTVSWDYRNKYQDVMEFYRKIIQFRTSEAGSVLKLTTAPPPGYIHWIFPNNSAAIGYILNNSLTLNEKRVMILINTDKKRAVAFHDSAMVRKWRLFTCTQTLERCIISVLHPYDAVEIPPVTAAVFVEV